LRFGQGLVEIGEEVVEVLRKARDAYASAIAEIEKALTAEGVEVAPGATERKAKEKLRKRGRR